MQRIVVHLINSLEGGGTERTLVALLGALSHHRLRHEVVTLRGAGALAAHLDGRVACHAMNVKGRSLLAGLKIARMLRGRPIGLIHARNTGCWADALTAHLLLRGRNPGQRSPGQRSPGERSPGGCRLVLGFGGLDTDAKLSAAHRRRIKWACRFGARFCTVSSSGRKKLIREGRVPSKLIDVIPNGVVMERFLDIDQKQRQGIRGELGFKENHCVIGTVASMTTVKNPMLLLGAVAGLADRFRHVRLLLVGDGPLREQLEAFTRAKGLLDRVRFIGSREDIPKLLAALDIYACTSLSEGMSNSILEAMASGLPIVATDIPGNALLVRNGIEGRLTKPQNVQSLQDHLANLVNSAALRWQYGGSARRRAKRFSFQTMVNRYQSYYASLVGSNPGGKQSMVPGKPTLNFHPIIRDQTLLVSGI